MFTYMPHIHAAQAYDSGAWSDFSNFLCSSFRFLHAPADDTCIGPEMNKGPSLSASNAASTARDEQDPVSCV
jgi:hypothetical protein